MANPCQGYHVQVTARSDRDITPESIIQKVSDASGSKYAGTGSAPNTVGPPAPVSSKPAFTPTRSSAGGGGFNPLTHSQIRSTTPKDTNVDEDGWGADAPPVTRTQLEKVQSSYQPTKVNMRELGPQNPASTMSSRNEEPRSPNVDSDVVKGEYRPVGKVDIASLRKQAQATGTIHDDRPTAVKGSYEPVGKVDIAAIRARAQKPPDGAPFANVPSDSTKNAPINSAEEPRSLPDRSAPSPHSERLTSLPKPKVGSRFGAGAGSFAGTKAPTPGSFGLESKTASTTAPTGVGRTFADQGGKTPAQLWSEKKARERGLSGASDSLPTNSTSSTAAPITGQSSGGGEWKSGYGGKSWAPVQTSRTGQSAASVSQQNTGQDDEYEEGTLPVGNIGAVRDRFKDTPPMGTSDIGSLNPPPLETSSKPNAGRGIPIPGLPSRPPQSRGEEGSEAQTMPPPPPQPPRSPTPPTPPAMDTGSPVRIAMPVSRGHNEQEIEDASGEQTSPPPAMPARSLAQVVPPEDDLTDETMRHDPARAAGENVAATSFSEGDINPAQPEVQESGKRALVQYDYDKAEDNEVELREGDYVTNIEMVDDDWWQGQNAHGETGLFPSNYVELVEDEDHASGQPIQSETAQTTASALADSGATATALYDYEAAEGNELSFPENAKITGVVSISWHTVKFLTFCPGISR